MKVLIVTMSLPLDPENINGGVSAAVYNLLPGFSEMRNLDLHILTFNREIKSVCESNVANNITIHFEPYKLFGWSKIDFVLKSFFVLRKYLSVLRPDIIHYQFHGFFLFMRLFLLNSTIKEAVTFHGLTKREAVFAGENSVKIVKRFNEFVNYFVLPDNVVFISQFSRIVYSKFKFKNQIVVFNSVNSIFFENSPKNYNENKLLYVGHISPLKNLLLLLSAINLLRKESIFYQLDVIGPFSDPGYQKIILDYVKINNLDSIVKFYGSKTQNEISDLMAKADALVVTSRHENLPIVIAEAMASGKVVIASAVGGIPEMIKNYETGLLFSSNNQESLCKILRTLPSIDLFKLGQNAKLFAIENFSSLSNSKKIFNFYTGLYFN